MWVRHALSFLPQAHPRSGPILLGSDSHDEPDATEVKELTTHHDEDQVQLDVNRSFVYYPEGVETQAE